MLDKITIKGRYKGANKRGLIVGGILFRINDKSKTADVTEETYLMLQAGVKNGWFVVDSHNYDLYLTSRGRKATTKVTEVEESVENQTDLEEGKDGDPTSSDATVADKNDVSGDNTTADDKTEETATEETATEETTTEETGTTGETVKHGKKKKTDK